LNLNDIPWHTAAGGWGPRVPLEAPALPATNRSVTVNSLSEFNTAASVAGTRITIGTSWAGNTFATINANDIDVIIPPGIAIGAIELGNWPRDYALSRVRIRGTTPGTHSGGRMGQYRDYALVTDVVIDGIDINGDSGFGGGETNDAIRPSATRMAVLNSRVIAAGYTWLGGARHVVIANSNFYHGAATRAAVGYAEGWGIRSTGGPMTIIDSRVQGTRYHNIRMHSVGGTGELLYVGRSTIVAMAEGRTAWMWNNLNNPPYGFGQGAIMEGNDIYTYSAPSCGFGPEISSVNVDWSRVANNRFYGGGTAVFNSGNLTANSGGTEGNTFASLSSFPSWGGPGDPRQVPLPNGLAVITGEGVCPGFTTTTTPPTTHTLTTSVTGNGTITGTGISCGSDCAEAYTSDTSVTLTAIPSSGNTFSGWGGSCSGTGSCTVTMSQARSVTATFATTPSAVNGSCGTSNGATLTAAPTTNLCTLGTASAVSGSGPWSWTCAGSNGGTTASCSASLQSTTPPPPTSGTMYYFSDCQTGAHASCVPGNNANAGTSSSAPKRDLTGFDVNAVPAGTNLLFARGGAWNFSSFIRVQNLNVTTAEPLTFDAYTPSWGGTLSPVFQSNATVSLFEFGTWSNTSYDGGYVIRNLKLDGMGIGTWGLWLRDHMHDLLLENVEITRFAIGIHAQSAPYVNNSAGVNRITLRNVNVHHNSDMGYLGKINDSVIENSLFESNNFSGSGFSHAIYWSGGYNNILRNNIIRNNSVVNGVCTGGNVTLHGQFDNMLMENNTILQVAATGGCYGFSITSGYSTAEWFRNFIVRGNTIINVGYEPILAHAAPNIIIENNRVKNTQAQYQVGVHATAGTDGGALPTDGDDVTTNAVIRNNLVCFTQSTSPAVRIDLPATGVETGTIYRTGADATTGACAF